MCGVGLSEWHRRAQEAAKSGREEEDRGRDDAARAARDCLTRNITRNQDIHMTL